MKQLVRNFLLYTIALFTTTQLLVGFRLHGNLSAYLIAGITLTLMMLLLRPLIKLLSIPLNIITFGLFSFLINAIILFLLTIFVTSVTIEPFSLPGITFLGFVIPSIALNKWFAYLVASFVLSGVYSILTWILTE